MIVGALSGRGILPLIKVPSNVKINADYYVKYVLKPIIEKFIPSLYPSEVHKIFLHHDKASSHTTSKTQQYLEQARANFGINFISNTEIPVKSPDASPLDFYGFGFLKQKLFYKKPKTLIGLWKACKTVWSGISTEDLTSVFDSWKRRCRQIVKVHGSHVEQTKQIHKRKL